MVEEALTWRWVAIDDDDDSGVCFRAKLGILERGIREIELPVEKREERENFASKWPIFAVLHVVVVVVVVKRAVVPILIPEFLISGKVRK